MSDPVPLTLDPVRAKPAVDDARLLDHFAAAALTGLLSAHAGKAALPSGESAARMAYDYAGHLLAERTLVAHRQGG